MQNLINARLTEMVFTPDEPAGAAGENRKNPGTAPGLPASQRVGSDVLSVSGKFKKKKRRRMTSLFLYHTLSLTRKDKD